MAEVSGMILVLLHHIRRSYYAISMATHPIEVSALGWNFHLGITFIAIFATRYIPGARQTTWMISRFLGSLVS